ncbi:rCG25684, isoform CRA_b [Rattus norvegicus]|uniref:RCG25684, isoform CRA_b n=1 Tax=Rattus norvegicus TaxID=10116 RepID=A6I1D4_RAT|nr:rCG25684, isoform CRA_b [Rattus norvegicus]
MLKDDSESTISTCISQSRPPQDRTAICVAGLSYTGGLVVCVCFFPIVLVLLHHIPCQKYSYKYFSLLWALHFCKC